MKHHLAALALCATLTCGGCHQATEPAWLIDQETMVGFLTEAHLMESYYYLKTDFRYDSVRPLANATYDTLFQQHGITREAFDSSLAYYSRHDEQLLAIYQEVDKNLEALFSK